MDINHISVSRKKCHDTCEQQYKFRYHLKLAVPGPEPIYLTYGTMVHKIAELYVENEGKRPIGDIATDILRGKIPMKVVDGKDQFAPTLPDEYKRKLPKHLRAIQNLNDKIGWDGIIEYEFKYDLEPPNNRRVTGFIDRLILKGVTKDEEGNVVNADKAFIIDYKTTKKGKGQLTEETVKTDLQLRMYARVVNREFGVAPENIKAALYYLEGERLIAACYNEESLLAVEKELLASFIRIEKADPDKVWGKVGWHCQWCDYKTLCPFYSGSAAGSKAQQWDGNLDTLGHDGGGW
jgi:CRISPR/Cas system-associated exonuclease Cas4 (RecB family)